MSSESRETGCNRRGGAESQSALSGKNGGRGGCSNAFTLEQRCRDDGRGAGANGRSWGEKKPVLKSLGGTRTERGAGEHGVLM